MKKEDHKAHLMMEEDLIEKGNRLYVTSVTILDTLQGIAKHLIVKMETIKRGMHLYVCYAINLDTQRDIIEWTRETSTEILISEETTTEMTEGMITTMITIKMKQSKNMLMNSRKHL